MAETNGTIYKANGVLLLGSVPLTDTETVLRKCSAALPDRLRYIPDGETGERFNFIAWQIPKFAALAPEVLSPFGDWGKPADPPVPEAQIQEAAKKLEALNTDYDTVAIESYQTFKRLRSEGVISAKTKFLVCLPSPVTMMAPFITADYKTAVESIYQNALFRALENITKEIPAQDLAVQWDAPLEFALLEGVWVKPWFSPVKEGILERLIKLGEQVNSEVEMGYHFCYGDIGHQHFTEPKGMGLLVEAATHVLKNINRRVDYIHMPVPKSRDDAEYFAPLKSLQAVRGDTMIYLGLVHPNDLEGTQSRVKTASGALDNFGVSSECGLGRTPLEELDSIFESSVAVSNPVM